jgi:hypothetical protein
LRLIRSREDPFEEQRSQVRGNGFGAAERYWVAARHELRRNPDMES